jgi:hypothetical protein
MSRRPLAASIAIFDALLPEPTPLLHFHFDPPAPREEKTEILDESPLVELGVQLTWGKYADDITRMITDRLLGLPSCQCGATNLSWPGVFCVECSNRLQKGKMAQDEAYAGLELRQNKSLRNQEGSHLIPYRAYDRCCDWLNREIFRNPESQTARF